MNLLRNNKGFTLIEIIVVIVILGIISAIAVPKVVGNITTARVNTVKQNLEIVKSVINTDYASKGTIPAAETNVDSLLSGKTLDAMAIDYAVSGTTYTLTANVTGAPYNLGTADVTTGNFPAVTYTLLPATGDKTQVQISVSP